MAEFQVVLEGHDAEMITEEVTAYGYGVGSLSSFGMSSRAAQSRARVVLAMQSAGSRFTYSEADGERLMQRETEATLQDIQFEALERIGNAVLVVLSASVERSRPAARPPITVTVTYTERTFTEAPVKVAREIQRTLFARAVRLALEEAPDDGIKEARGLIYLTDLRIEL